MAIGVNISLQRLMCKLQDKYGEDSVMFAGDMPRRAPVSSGSLALDFAIGFGGLPSDRLLAEWHLTAPPAPPGTPLEIALPEDLDRLMDTDPGAALRLRLALRRARVTGTVDWVDIWDDPEGAAYVRDLPDSSIKHGKNPRAEADWPKAAKEAHGEDWERLAVDLLTEGA